MLMKQGRYLMQPNLKAQRLEDYSLSDLRQYFVSRNSFVPFIDEKGNKRVACITDIEEEGRIRYKAINKTLTGLTTTTFRKSANNFSFDGSVHSKFVKDSSGNIVVLAPNSIRTVDKALSYRNFYKKNLLSPSIRNINEADYHLIYEYFWGDIKTVTISELDLSKPSLLSRKVAYHPKGYLSLLGASNIKLPKENIKDVIEEHLRNIGEV